MHNKSIIPYEWNCNELQEVRRTQNHEPLWSCNGNNARCLSSKFEGSESSVHNNMERCIDEYSGWLANIGSSEHISLFTYWCPTTSCTNGSFLQAWPVNSKESPQAQEVYNVHEWVLHYVSTHEKWWRANQVVQVWRGTVERRWDNISGSTLSTGETELKDLTW